MPKETVKFILITKHIHSGFASFQTGDVFVVIATNSKAIDFQITENSIIHSKDFPMLNGEFITEVAGDDKFTSIHVESDKTFYNKVRYSKEYEKNYSKTPEFSILVQSYLNKGFKIDKHIPEQKEYWNREKIREQKKAKKDKLVLWMGYDTYSVNPHMYQGGFSDEVFNSTELQAYVNRGVVYGWIGDSSSRTAAHDKQIEAGLRKRGISPSNMYNWISSRSGRHFADALYGVSPKKQKEIIARELNQMYNDCIVFGCPTHSGTIQSTNVLEDVCRKLGILLPLNETYNHKQHMNNLMLAKKALHEQKELTPIELYIYDLISDIFANKL